MEIGTCHHARLQTLYQTRLLPANEHRCRQQTQCTLYRLARIPISGQTTNQALRPPDPVIMLI